MGKFILRLIGLICVLYTLLDLSGRDPKLYFNVIKDSFYKTETVSLNNGDRQEKKNSSSTDSSTDSSIEIISDICMNSHIGGRRSTEDITGVILHTTNNYNSYADSKWHGYFQDTTKRKVSWHYSIDDTGVYLQNNENLICYHAGSPEGNKKLLGVEYMCYKGMNKSESEHNLRMFVHYIKTKYPDIKFYNHGQFNPSKKGICPSDKYVLEMIDYGNSLTK